MSDVEHFTSFDNEKISTMTEFSPSSFGKLTNLKNVISNPNEWEKDLQLGHAKFDSATSWGF